MRNSTFCKSGFSRLILFILFAVLPITSFAQVCGTPGVDGPVAVSSSVNTYYPISGNITLNAGAQSILLAGVPATDQYSNNFGATPISAGDLILIIQMQDATINYTNTISYGSGTTSSGPDNQGGTGFTSLGNTGVFEYVIATNSVPLSGGNLTFKGTGANNGVLNSFYNANATTTRGKRTFQVVRVPQYSNLTLTANITTPPFNGVAGGIIAFNVSGTFNFNGFSIDGSARGFRGGYSPKADSNANDSKTYVDDSSKSNVSGKGEGIAGTPKYMWDGFNQVASTVEGMPGGSAGRGAPANAGGGGNDHNTGGGGGGNGGFGGLGGAGWQGGGGDLFSNYLTGAGRPGSKSYVTTTKFPRLIMGGGGGAGDANNASSGVKGGVGGAIILINAGNVLGSGTIYANGGKGAPGTYASSPDGAGGGGAGGTVLLNVSNNSTANIKIEANGGAGGNTENDDNNEHGPGGGGGGGIICHNVSSTVAITTSVLGGAAGKSNAGKGINHGAVEGKDGYVSTFTVADVPPNLQVNANCFPVLETKVKTLSTTAVCNAIDEKVSYEIEIKNTGAGNAAGVMLDFSFPPGIEFDSATAVYSTGASGPAGTLSNSATANNPVFGGFNIAQIGVVTITLVGKVATSIAAGTYSANAQALYLDPTRTIANSTRRITAFTNAYGSANKTYEGTGQSNVPGVNFSGTGTAVDNISILALPAAPTVSVTQTTCASPTGTITVNTPANDSGISYTLTGTNPISASVNSTTGIFSGLVPGTYSVTTTNEQGCTSAANTGIVINAVDGAPTTTGVTICQGETGSLTASSACAVSSSIGPLFGIASNVDGIGSVDWLNPTGANSNGSGVASASSNNNRTTKYLHVRDFKFSIPANAKIKGIAVTIGRYASLNNTGNNNNNNVSDNVVSLIKANAIVGENKKSAVTWSNSSTAVVTYGGGADLWTATWTPDEINNAGFGIALAANISKSGNNTVTAYVDYMQITVSYTIGEIEWYTTSTGGSSIYTGTSFNPVGVTGSGLTSTATATTKTYYAACSGNANCRAAVNFVINAKPTITGIAPNSRCGAGEVTLGATASAGTINWYAASTGGSSLGTGESFTTPSLSTTTSYYVEATDNGCVTPTRTEVKATINSVPTINSTTEGSICGSGSVKLTATASNGVTINWYADPTSSKVLETGTTFNTPILTATTTYYVGAVTSLGCTSTSRIAVAAVVNNASTIVFTSGTQNPTVCSGASVPSAVYTFGGSATNATVSNLPAGLSAAVDANAKTVTISGNPTAAGTYTITTVGHTAPCIEATIQGIVSITPNVSIAPFSPATSSRCQGVETITKTTTATNSTGITYSLDSASSAGGNTINSATGAVTYAAGWSGITTVTASAAGCNGPVTTTYIVTTNASPTATISGNLTACLTTTLTANSNANSPTYVWYKDNAAISGQTSSKLVVNSNGDYKVKVRNSSGCESTSATSTVKFSDTEKPVKPVLADITGECSATAAAPTTTDNCAGTVTGTTADPLTYNAQGTYTINWTFNDGNGNVETAVQKVIIKDTEKPVKPVLADITGECSATAAAPTAIDNCAGTVTGTTTDPLAYNAQGTYTINWTFNDGNGNVETATQKVIVKDTEKPVKPTLADITGECSATAAAPTTTDNCAGTVTGTTTDPLAYNAQGTYTINWTFDDGNGNVETAVQKVIIKDTEKPVKPTLADITGECSATATAPITTDNCAGTVTGTTSDPLAYNAQGTYTINWTFNDGNGNTETAAQKVIVKDTQKPVKPTLADITGECSATATAPTTTDNCAGTVTGTTTDPLAYNAQGTYTINWTFDDGNGNTETAAQKVIVKDTQKPVKPTLADITGECSATATAPTTTDNCAGTVTGTTTDPLAYNAQGTYTINWTFDDGNGNTETAAQKVIVKDTQKPVKPTLADITGECSATATAPTTTDNCAGTVTGTTSDPLAYNAQGTYTINWTFNDGNGNTETAAQKVIVKDTQKPVKPTLADITGECSATATAPTTTDNCAGTVTGTTSDPLAYNAQGTYTINWTFNDGNGNTETAAQKVIVKDTEKPVKPTLADITGECSVTAAAPTATDNCAGTVTGTTTDPLAYNAQGTYTINWTFDDGNGNVETAIQKVIVKDTEKPVKPVLADITGECSATAAAPTTTDNCAGTVTGTTADPLTYTAQGTYTINWTFNDGNGNVETATQKVIVKDTEKPVKPTLADITGECSATAAAPTATDNCAGTVTGTTADPLTYTDQGTYTINWTFDDGNGNVETAVQNVIIKDTEKPAKPVLADITGECSATAAAPTATDNCAGTVTGTTSDPLAYNAQGTYTINWTFDDGNGNVETAVQKVIIKDTEKPVKPVLADITGECSATAAAPTTTDNCAGTVTGTTTDPLAYNAQGTYTINWTFDDGNGNVETAVQKVIIKDTEKPVKPVLADITGECSATAAAPTTTDNCAGTVTGTTADPLAYNAQGTYTINWTFDDGNGNVETAVQNVIVKDTEKPVKPTLADITGECSVTAAAPTATDNCAGTVTGTTTDPLAYNAQGTYTINWTFDDGNGNVETAVQNVIIKDTQKPVKPVLADITGECSATAAAPTATDNCAGTVTGTTSDPLAYNAQGTYTINWTFNDGNGNVETATQKVIVKDTEKPVKPTLADITGECSATAAAPTATDNCAGTVTGTTSDPLTYNAQGAYTINWTFNDGNGNVEAAVQKVIIKDTEKPVKPVLADITGECSATAAAPTTTDNCAGTVTGTTADPLAYNAQGTYTINWTFDDGNGNVETAVQNVIVKDTEKPVKPTLADITGECSVTAAAPTATDNCAGTVTGTTTDPLAYNAQGTYTINWTFDDGNGNVETAVQNVIIKDTQKPVKPVLADITGECSATAAAPTATDNCAGTVTGTTTDPLAYNAQGTYTINWTFDDGNGNVETATQKVIVKDTEKPVKPTLADITGECSATAAAPTATDNCAGTVTGTTSDPLTYNAQGAYTINWTFNDGNGNVEAAVQKVIIKDTEKPVKPVLADITGECSATAAAPTTTDNCAGTVTGTTADPLAYNAQGTYMINWTFNDGNGNVETAVQKVIIKDTQKPSITCPLAVSVSADANSCAVTGVVLGTPTVSDNCMGTVAVTNDAPSSFPIGDTTVTWTAKDGAGNIETCTQIVKVIGAIIANDDNVSSSNGVSGGIVIANILDNDVLNCNKVNRGDIDITVNSTVPSVLIFNTVNGAVSVKPNTPTGIYTFDYSICEIANSKNCNTATVKVEIVNDLIAVKDDFGTKSSGSTSAILGNVKSNDTLDGAFVTSGNTVVTVGSDGPLSVDANGDVTLAANTPSGIYSITYEICEKDASPSNCKTAIAEVKVANTIDAVPDAITPINGNIGETTVSLIGNDTLNGNQAVIGTNSGEVTINIVGTLPSGLALNANGTITVAPNTPKGNYNVEYVICEVGAAPANCDLVTITVPVTAGNLVANEDIIPSVLGSNVPQTLGKNVFDNDTKNAQPLNPSDVTLKTTAADPKGYLTVDADGNIVLGANPPAGDYELTYEICEKLNLDNCSSNTVKVTVGTPVIDAVEDVIASINGNIGGTTISLIANDKLNGNPITVGTAAGEVKFEIVGTLPSGLTLNSDYTITVAPNTPAADYNVEYKICENTNPTNCDSVITVVKVTGGNLVANEDLVPSAVGVNVPQKVINVFENDTKDGNKLVPSDVDLKVTQADPKGYLTVDADGNVVLAPNAPAGEYELTYTICEKLNPNNCNSNTVKVTVAEPKMTVVANSYCSNNVPYVNYTVTPDNFTTNNLLTVKWIDSNNNVVATQTNLPLSGNILWPGAEIDSNQNGTDWPGWILNNGIWAEGADGFEATRNGVKMEFSLNPTVTVSVAYPSATPDCNARPTFSIKANNDEAGPVNAKKGANANINIFENDLLNGAKLKASDVILSVPVLHPNISLNADGSINIAVNTADGVYELTYQICEAANASNCSQAVIKITVDNVVDPTPPTENKITLNNDNDVSADGINGSLEIVNVLDNDLINGQPINPADVIIKPITESPYFEWNADGTVNVKPNTPGGNYPLTYQVCEKANGTNCSTAVLNVFVEVPAISVIKTAVFNDENKSGFANAGETITYKFTVTNTGNVPLVGITINDPLPGVVVSGQAINLGVNESNETNFTAVYKITQEDINRGSVSNQATVKGSSVRGVVVEDQSDDASNSGDSPTVLDLNGCSIKVMNAFSPNGDSKNARFYIRGIECYPDNTVEIYNRWGVLVFSIDQYNNNDRVFEGYSNGRSTIKQTDGLPVGTYFYVLKYKDSAQKSHQESGYLYLNK